MAFVNISKDSKGNYSLGQNFATNTPTKTKENNSFLNQIKTFFSHSEDTLNESVSQATVKQFQNITKTVDQPRWSCDASILADLDTIYSDTPKSKKHA